MAERTPEEIADHFQIANRAFDVFTLDERREALEVFAGLEYARIEDRLMEAVYRVIRRRENLHATPRRNEGDGPHDA